MRTFHTHSKACGVAYEGHAGSIGRMYPSCAHTTTPLGLQDLPPDPHTRRFNNLSTADIVTNSIKEGLVYVRRQISGLSDSEVMIRELISTQSEKTHFSGISPPCKRKFFFQSLSSITEGRYKSFPLFGFGCEPPMRLHMRISNVRFTEILSPVPLLNQASFRSLCLTLGLDEDVERSVTEKSVSEILNLMLETKSKEDRLKDFFHKLENERKQAQFYPDKKSHAFPGFLKTLKERFFKSILTRSRPKVPV